MAAPSRPQVLLLGPRLSRLTVKPAVSWSSASIWVVFLLIFTAETLVVAIPAVLLIPHQCWFQTSSELPHSAPTSLDHTFVLLLGRLSPFLPPVCFLFAFKLRQGLICHLKFLLPIFPLISLKSYTQWHFTSTEVEFYHSWEITTVDFVILIIEFFLSLFITNKCLCCKLFDIIKLHLKIFQFDTQLHLVSSYSSSLWNMMKQY